MPPNHRVVVAEEDRRVRELIRTGLNSLGYYAYTAPNGMDALDRVYAVQPDAVALDINLPASDGFGVLETLRARNQVTPVPVLTARHEATDSRRAVALGSKDDLTKPFTEGQLEARIAKLRGPRSPIGLSLAIGLPEGIEGAP